MSDYSAYKVLESTGYSAEELLKVITIIDNIIDMDKEQRDKFFFNSGFKKTMNNLEKARERKQEIKDSTLNIIKTKQESLYPLLEFTSKIKEVIKENAPK